MYKLHHCIFLILFTGCHLIIFGQQTTNNFEKLNADYNSPSRNVNVIVQDAAGYIWFGSDEGLSRFDGYNCISYKHENGNPHSLSDNAVFAVCIDGVGSLWIGTSNGLNRFDAVNNNFEVFLHDENNYNSISENNIMSLAKDTSGTLWIGTYGGGIDKVVLSKQGYHFAHYRHSEKENTSISSNQIFSIAFDKNDNLWAGTSNGLNLLPHNTKSAIKFFNDPLNPQTIADSRVNRIFTANDGTIWISGYNMLDKIIFNPLTFSLSVQHILPMLSLHEEWVINDFLIDSKNNCWAATNNQGLVRFTDEKNGISNKKLFTWNPQNPFGLPSSNSYSVFEDLSGVIYTGTSKGIAKYIPSKDNFDAWAYLQTPLPKMNFIISIATDNNNNLWLAPDNDSLIILHKNALTNYPSDHASFDSYKMEAQINIMHSCVNGDMFVGTMQHGFYIAPSTKKYNINNWQQISTKRYPLLPSDYILSVTEDKSGLLWIGTYKGLCSFNKKTNTLTPVYSLISDQVEGPYIIRAITVGNEDDLWCGTDDGIRVFKNNKQTAAYTDGNKSNMHLSNRNVTCLFKDRNSNIWVGTMDGLTLFEYKKKSSIIFKTKNGLPDDGIRSIVEDAQGNIWIATNHGLGKYIPSANKFISYTTKDGLIADQFITKSACLTSDGLLHFGTNNGLVSFNPKLIKPNSYIPPVQITQVNIMNKNIEEINDTLLLKTFRQKKILQLAYNQNFFSFEFAALNYLNSENNQYAYQLTGIDKDWVFSGTHHIATYTNINPGHYIFKIKGCNNDGIWNDTPTTIEINIAPPWWRTWWFYTLCILTCCFLLWIIYRVRIHHLLTLYKLRSSIAKDLHDDVGSALSSIAMLSKLAQDGKIKAALKPEEIYTRIGNTSKRMVDLMDDIVWSVNPNNDRFSNMLVRMREYAAEMLEPININYTFNISDSVEVLRIPMQMRKDYFLIFKEAINNLTKYALCSEALISIEKQHHSIVTTIKDNGIGFDASIITSGNGLQNMKARALALKGNIEFITSVGKGTEVKITIAAN